VTLCIVVPKPYHAVRSAITATAEIPVAFSRKQMSHGPRLPGPMIVTKIRLQLTQLKAANTQLLRLKHDIQSLNATHSDATSCPWKQCSAGEIVAV